MVMGRCLYGASGAVSDWLKNRLECNPFTSIGVLIGNELVGAIGYEYYSERHKDVAICAYGEHPKWWSRSVFTQAFKYPFELLGVRRVSSVVVGDNTQSLDFHERLPFVREGIRRKAYDGKDQHLFRMDKTKAMKSKWWVKGEMPVEQCVWCYNGEDIEVIKWAG